MGSWLLKLLSKGMKSKTKDNKYQPKTIIKNIRKIKWEITPTMDNYPRNRQMGGTNPQSDVMLTQVMNNLLPGVGVVLESIQNNAQADFIE